MATINVPDDQPTIQAAIDVANPGDTIIVQAGIYIEQVTINKSLTLLGAKAGIDARTRVQTGESIIQFSPGFASSIVNVQATDIIIDGFTITMNTSTPNYRFAIFTGSPGNYPPSTTVDTTGLQIINNVIINNSNGIVISSSENAIRPTNYLVQYNYFQNNSGDGSFSLNGLSLFIGNDNNPMSNVSVRQNYFNGGSQFASIYLQDVNSSEIIANVLNFDSSITLVNCTNILINKNVSYAALRSGSSTSTANAINLTNSTNIGITNNLIYNATSSGIVMNGGTDSITITGNCIVNNTLIGVSVLGTGNSNLVVNNNNIQRNDTGLLKSGGIGVYTGTLNAVNNYWDSPNGPDYNATGEPGDGQIITDQGTPQVEYEPFLTSPIACPSPITVTKTTPSVNVDYDTPIEYTYTVTINPNDVNFQLTALVDQLPILNSQPQWQIISENPPGFFTIVPGNPQFLAINVITPTTLDVGTVYTVTIQAPTDIIDAGQILDNTASTSILIGGLEQTYARTATASVAICLHSSSKVKLADGTEKKIEDIVAGDLVLGGNGKPCQVVEQIPCLVVKKYWTRAIVFEPDSLGPGVPSERLAIDPGHPVCTPEEYEQMGDLALKPAKSYLKEGQIYYKGWKNMPELLSGENRRYDLVLDQTISQTYMANGMVVRGRNTRLEPGYNYV